MILEHLHQWLTDGIDLVMALGALVAAVSSIANGRTLSRHSHETDERHKDNSAKLNTLLNRTDPNNGNSH